MNAPTAPAAPQKKSERSEAKNAPECRGAYLFLHKKREKNAARVALKTPRFDGTWLFPKLNADPGQCPNYMFLYGLVVEAARKMWPGNVDPASGQWVWPQGAQFPIKDGDVPLQSKPKPGVTPKTPEQLAEANKWRRGYWVIEATNYLDPGPRVAVLVNGQILEIPAQTVNGQQMWKSGDWCIPNIHAWAYENETFGVNFGFEGVLFTKPGEAIGSSGQRSAASMFGGIAPVAAPAAMPPMPGHAPMPAPQTYAPPPAAPVAAAPPMPPVQHVAPPPAAPTSQPLPPMPGQAPAAPAAPQGYAPPPMPPR